MQYHKIVDGYATDSPGILSKCHPKLDIDLIMTDSISKYDIVSAYSMEVGSIQRQIDGAEWADWDQRGRLIYASEGKLFAADVDITGAYNPVQIADFNDDKPTQVPPPEWATVW